MSNAKVSVRDLNLYFDKQHILKNVNIEIPENKVTVILGPSGCGKTTLLRTLNRLVDLSDNATVTGSIMMDGEDILHPSTDLVRIRQKMGLLSQRPTPLPMSIFSNVAYGLKLKGIKRKKELSPLIEKYLREANIWDELKVGQQQRLCLARGLAVNPEIILADEPTSALDPISAKIIEDQFAQLKKGYTIVLVTHVLRQAKRIADYVVFMYLGDVIEQGNAEDFFNNPQQEKTKEYLRGAFN